MYLRTALLAGVALAAAAPAGAELNDKQLGALAKRSVVFIQFEGKTESGASQIETATGFLVSDEGYVITALHTFKARDEKGEKTKAEYYDFYQKSAVVGGKRDLARAVTFDLIDRDEDHDLALLKLLDTSDVVAQAPLCRQKPEFAEPIFVYGFPFNGPLAPLRGNFSDINDPNHPDFWAMSVATEVGTSGAPVYDMDGRVRAVNLGGKAGAPAYKWGAPLRLANKWLLKYGRTETCDPPQGEAAVAASQEPPTRLDTPEKVSIFMDARSIALMADPTGPNQGKVSQSKAAAGYVSDYENNRAYYVRRITKGFADIASLLPPASRGLVRQPSFYEDNRDFWKAVRSANLTDKQIGTLVATYTQTAADMAWFRNADQTMKEAVAAYPNNPYLAASHASILMDEERYDDALRILDRMIPLTSGSQDAGLAKANYDIRKMKGMALWRSKHYAEAVDVLEKVKADQDPTSEQYFRVLSDLSPALSGLGKADQAIDYLREASEGLRRNPDWRERVMVVENNLAWALLQRGKPSEARAYANSVVSDKRKASGIPPSSLATSLTNLGSADLTLGILDAASQNLGAAADIYASLNQLNAGYVLPAARVELRQSFITLRNGDKAGAVDQAEAAARRISGVIAPGNGDLVEAKLMAGAVHFEAGEKLRACVYFDEAAEAAGKEFENTMILAMLAGFRGACQRERGNQAEADRLLQECRQRVATDFKDAQYLMFYRKEQFLALVS